MQMIRVFPRKTTWTPTDELAFVGNPPLFQPVDQPVHISVTFTWDIEEGKRLFRQWSDFYKDVRIGGPAFDNQGGSFVPGRYLKEGVTITSRGCPRKCPFCFVPKREGPIREIPIQDGWIVQDNNLLACSRKHIEAVFEMLKRQPKRIKFAGGLDARLLKDWHLELVESIRLDEMWFACDSEGCERPLQRVADMTAHMPINKKRCFVLIGYNGESIEDAEARLGMVYGMGFLPFAQLYQPADHPREWKRLAKKWCRPAAYRSKAA